MILFVNACVRQKSRTKLIAERYLSKLGGEIEEVFLPDFEFPKVSEEFLAFRDNAAKENYFSSFVFDLARQFCRAEEVVIAAPHWDLSFPSILKQYLEQVTVCGLTFRYSEDGRPLSLCRAKKLTYITTSGGPLVNETFGFGYVKALFETFFGAEESIIIKAENLDIVGVDVDMILNDCIKAIIEENTGKS